MATHSQRLPISFSDPAVDEVVRNAVDKAIETHRRLGQSIVVMRDGKITWIAPEDIPPLKEAVAEGTMPTQQ